MSCCHRVANELLNRAVVMEPERLRGAGIEWRVTPETGFEHFVRLVAHQLPPVVAVYGGFCINPQDGQLINIG